MMCRYQGSGQYVIVYDEGDHMHDYNWLTSLIREYTDDYPKRYNTRTVWGQAQVAVADADDPRFLDLKIQVGPGHLLPQDLLPGARSIICYFLPFARSIGRSNKPGDPCSDEWAYAYLETNRLINHLNAVIQEELARQGYRAAVTPATHNFDEKTLLSDWSHRHIAVIAGLGTLGLNRMLITDQGCCGRVGSLATDMEIDPASPEAYSGCLYFYNESCRQCITNCTQGALQIDGFDRHKCYGLLLKNAGIHQEKGFADACGKCLSNVPCSFVNPVKKLLTRKVGSRTTRVTE